MAITLSDGGATINLHPDLYWSDENNWHPVEQTVTRTVTGALVLEVGTRIAGRPVTLEAEDDNSAWMTREVIELLRNWAAVPGKEMVLTLRGEAFDVVFRHQDGGLETVPVKHMSDVQDEDFYRCTLRFMEI